MKILLVKVNVNNVIIPINILFDVIEKFIECKSY